jgi:hypothetical protein
MRERVEAVAQELAQGKLKVEESKAGMVRTRNEVGRAWLAVGDILIRDRQPELAAQIVRFIDGMPEPRTEREHIAAGLLASRPNIKAREQQTTR